MMGAQLSVLGVDRYVKKKKKKSLRCNFISPFWRRTYRQQRRTHCWYWRRPRRITNKLQSKERNLNKTSLQLVLKNLCTSSQKKMHGIPSKLHNKPRVLSCKVVLKACGLVPFGICLMLFSIEHWGYNTKGGSNGHSNHADHMVNVSSLSLSSLRICNPLKIFEA